MGTSPSSLTVLPLKRVKDQNQPVATIEDHVPMLNIMPFGMCMSPANPQVAAATAAAMGVLTPQPCIPMTMAPWAPGAPMTKITTMPELDDVSTCMCTWGGVVMVTMPGQVKTTIV